MRVHVCEREIVVDKGEITYHGMSGACMCNWCAACTLVRAEGCSEEREGEKEGGGGREGEGEEGSEGGREGGRECGRKGNT